MKFSHIALGAALLAPAGTAAAQTATDANCILVANAFAKNSKDANEQKAAEAALYFYLGRVKDSETGPQLKALFDSSSKTLSNANAGTTMQACMKTFQGKIMLLQSLAPAQAAQPAQPASPTPKKPEGR